MCAGVGDLVDPGDDPSGIDQERHALRVMRIRFVGAALDAVGATDNAIDVGQQPEAELLVRRERLVVGGCVERCSDDRGMEFVELWASVTEALPFARSTAGRRFGIPPQYDPRAAQVLEAHDALVLIQQREIRGGVTRCEHKKILTTMRTLSTIDLRFSARHMSRGEYCSSRS